LVLNRLARLGRGLQGGGPQERSFVGYKL